MGFDAARIHAELLAHQPQGARHDADICPLCRVSDQAAHAPVPSGDEPSGANQQTTDTPTQEGGTAHAMTDMSKETHEALLAKAVDDATKATTAALERKADEAKQLAGDKAELEKQLDTLTKDNQRLNKELDTAQVSLKSVRDENASLKADLAAKDEAARVKDVASKRVDQVKRLAIFPEDYVTERAERWAKVSDEEWAERIDEWTKAKPAEAAKSGNADTASAMTGASGDLTKDSDADSASDNTAPPRRRVLGLA